VRPGRQRRDGEGRHLLPNDRQEASARPGDRPREPAALPLPGRLGRRLPAAAGRGLPRSRALRAHLLQPGAAVGARHPTDRAGDGLIDGRRRLCAGHVGRDGDCQGDGHDLPRRPAAGEGGDRRGGERRGAGRGRGPYRDERRGRPLRAGRRARPGDRSRSFGRSPGAGRRRRGSAASRRRHRSIRRTSTASSRPTRGSPTTCAR